LDPNNPLGYIQRAITFSNTGKQDEAITDFNFAINYDPVNAEAYNGRGCLGAKRPIQPGD
jgi:Tfp pilus assembly protein PilF